MSILLLISYTIGNMSFHGIEVEILKELNLDRMEYFDGFFQIVSNTTSLISWAFPVMLLLIGILKKNIQLRQKSILLLSSVVVSTLISFILKHTIDRPRPFVTYTFFEKLSYGGSPSFPSGHTTEAFALAIALSYAYPKWYIIIPSLLWASAVGYSRMSLGVHYPSDVMAGIVIGAVSVFMCIKVLNQFKSTRLL